MRGMREPAYPAARVVASRLHAHFAKRMARSAGQENDSPAAVPDVSAIEAVIDTAFWASLRREEGYVPRISLALVSPSETTHPLLFERPLALDPGALTRVAPAVERAGIHLGVWRDRDELAVWGTTRTIPAGGFVLEVAAPGLLVVKEHHGQHTGKFINVAVLEGDQVKVVDARAGGPDGPSILTAFLTFNSAASQGDSANILMRLAVSMRAHGRGGLLLVVPPGLTPWRESVVQPISYALSPSFGELTDLSRETPAEEDQRSWQEALDRSVEAVAGLTAVDGATVLTTEYELLAFGAKIARRKGWPQVEHVTLTEPIEGGVATILDPTELGGTRHLAAAQFAHDQRDSIALVASQDGRFTLFAWSPREETVHAHRVETLLL
jgi:Probable sensor domain DACNV